VSPNQALRYVSNVELAICASLAAASTYYLIIREALPRTTLGHTYGDPWDWMIVVAALIASACVVTGTLKRRPMMRALGLIAICTLVLLIDLTYVHQRGFAVAAYAILSNLGIVVAFGAHAWLIVNTGGTVRRR
jgi:amino acid permease